MTKEKKLTIDEKVDQLTDVVMKLVEDNKKRELPELAEVPEEDIKTWKLPDDVEELTKVPTPADLREQVDDVLGKDFDLIVEKDNYSFRDTGRLSYRYTIIVPERLRLRGEANAYRNHHRTERSSFENLLVRQNPKITKDEMAKEVEIWDQEHPFVLPPDRRVINSKLLERQPEGLLTYIKGVRREIEKRRGIAPGEDFKALTQDKFKFNE